MKKKQFKTESKKLLDMMINSIYTHKEIFLRELISNASDAIDKLYFKSLTDSNIIIGREDFAINIKADKEARTLTITDNGCGMSAEELENNLGTIAKSGSYDFKRENGEGEGVDIIGQFGVGFYSAFMVADKITVRTRQYGSDVAHVWESEGVDGYSIGECEKATFGTEIILYIKEDTEEEKYSDFLEEYRLRGLVKKYSDYIRYPIKTEVTRRALKEGTENEYEDKTEIETLNSMIPLWKKAQGEVTDEEYKSFYTEKFYDYEAPARVITQKSEGTATYTALLFVPAHAPYNYYSKDYEKGLQLYSSGVMIMDKCADLLPDYFGFVKGLVDSADLSLNISRELLQHDRQLKVMAKAIEKKIKSELEKMMASDRSKYEKFFDAFGLQLKYGIYTDFGMHKDVLKDLILFRSSTGKYVSLKEYVDAMKEEQTAIYYAAGETIERIEMLPQVEAVRDRGYEVLYFTDEVDEFAVRILEKYADKEFKNVTAEALDIATEDEKATIKEKNESAEPMLAFIKETLGNVGAVRFTSAIKNHPVCLSTEGDLSLEMEKTLKKMPGAEGGMLPKATTVLEINANHPIADKLIALNETDRDTLAKYAKILYAEACLIGGVGIENPTEFVSLVSELIV